MAVTSSAAWPNTTDLWDKVGPKYLDQLKKYDKIYTCQDDKTNPDGKQGQSTSREKMRKWKGEKKRKKETASQENTTEKNERK